MPEDEWTKPIPGMEDYRPGTWWGVDRGSPKGDQSVPYEPVFDKEFRDNRNRTLNDRLQALIEESRGPTLEERQDRCEQMGLVFCSCKLNNGHVVIYSPTCPVHQHFCKLP